ncbi:MAG: hypothetical protein LBI13_01685 [Streptococcaceae bacterium]|jgi:hypothetical protein|nr:hypothetical protein [Streptococcaceae bacterium]
MENKQKLQKLLLAEQADLQKVVALQVPDFEAGQELGRLIKGDSDLSDSQTFLNIKNYGTRVALSLRDAKASAKKALEAVDEALVRVGK